MAHHLKFSRIVFVVVISATQATTLQHFYRMQKLGEKITGAVVKDLTVTSTRECSYRCLSDIGCTAYQYTGSGPGNCLLIDTNSTNTETTFSASKNDPIYKHDFCAFNTECLNGATCDDGQISYSCNCVQGYYGNHCEKVCAHDYFETWTPPPAWNGSSVNYWSFDSLECLVLMEGIIQTTFSGLTSGKVNNAVATNISQAQWIDLGVHAEACMTRPETCGAAGGAVSFWMKLIDCNDFGGVISTVSLSETGFQVYCSENKTKFRLFLPDGHFYTEVDQQPGNWTHVILNYLGPEDGMGIRLYLDGVFSKWASSKLDNTYSPGSGRIVVGRLRTDEDRKYASVELDELLLFNSTLTQEEIQGLSAHV